MAKKPVNGIWRSMRGLCFGSAAANFVLLTQLINVPAIPVRVFSFLIAEIPILIAAGMLYELLDYCDEGVDTRLANWTGVVAGGAISTNIILIGSAFGSFHKEFLTAGLVGVGLAIVVYLLVVWLCR